MHESSRWHLIFCVFFPRKNKYPLAHPLRFKLEILDTAGADQFRALHERYIKVCPFPFHHHHT